jgi:hypothetical protein
MRLGQNPAKFVDHVAQPARVTAAVVTYIPFLGGYYAESLDILKTCLGSFWQNTHTSCDLMVFDNASCPEVRSFLLDSQQEGKIQYLVLSQENVGKGGAWNFIFGSAPGELIAYADSDVYFYPGWLEAQLSLFEIFSDLGMVTGLPLRVPEEYSTGTVAWALSNGALRRGVLLSWEDWWKHARSLGVETEAEGRRLYDANQDALLEYQGKQYFIGAGHFQFVARRDVLQKVLPIPSDRPMGQVRSLDVAINEMGYLRLSTPEWWVQHLGNTLQDFHPNGKQEGLSAVRKSSRLSAWKPFRRLLVWINNRTFDLLYRNG